MKIFVYKDIESKFLLFLLIERSICNLYLQFGSTLFRVSTFQLGIRRLQVMLNTNYGRCSAVRLRSILFPMQFHSTMYLPLLWLSVWRPFFH